MKKQNQYSALIKQALQEDFAHKDITSQAVFGKGGRLTDGFLVARQDLVLSGLGVALEVFRQVSPKAKLMRYFRDGDWVQKGKRIAKVRGLISNLLSAERVALNFVQHLSGIATLTQQFVREVKPHPCRVLDTRKTLPGLRALEKQAVVDGGGENHRMNLSDMYLIKDNHIVACGGIREAIGKVKNVARSSPALRSFSGGGSLVARKILIEVEAKDLREVGEACEVGVDIILLDNMKVAQIRKAVELVDGRCLLEVSGGVNLKSVKKIAQTGVSRISIGALTHSAAAADIAFDIEVS